MPVRRMRHRRRFFKPRGKRQSIGLMGSLGDVEDYGPANVVTLVVGLDKGKEERHKRGRCARLPDTFDPAEVDDAFVDARAKQIGLDSVAATRRLGKGWWKGAPEDSVAYEVAYVGDEPSPAKFQSNMNRLAEALACQFCQESVLILRHEGQSFTAAGATCPVRRKRRKR